MMTPAPPVDSAASQRFGTPADGARVRRTATALEANGLNVPEQGTHRKTGASSST